MAKQKKQTNMSFWDKYKKLIFLLPAAAILTIQPLITRVVEWNLDATSFAVIVSKRQPKRVEWQA
jgi:hypothetical protein